MRVVRANRFGLLAIFVLAGCPPKPVDPQQATRSNNRLDLAKDFLRKHQLEAAETECNRALVLNPRNDEAFLVRGLVSLLHALDDQRTAEIESCLTGLDAEAMQKEQQQALEKADKDFAKALAVTPDYGEAWSDRGTVHSLLGDFKTAEAEYRHALENPVRLDSPGLSRADLGWALFHQQNYVDAAQELRQALQFQPKMCVATYRLARVYFAREEWEKAAELFQTASDDPSCGSQEASLYLMKTRMQQGLVDDARRARDACLRISPKSCVAQQCRADGGALGQGQP